MKTLNETVREIVAYARESGLDKITEEIGRAHV